MNRKIGALTLLMASTTSLANADVRTIDGKFGLPIHIVTSGPYMHTHAYPTCRTWSADSKSLFIETSAPRTDGTKANPLERQLQEINIETGEVRQLATLEMEDTKQYGAAQVGGSSMYHSDYSPVGVMVYYDVSAHNIYLMDVKTGRSELLIHEKDGFIGDPPSISTDGTRIAYYVAYPIPESPWFSDAIYTALIQDIDPKTLKAVGAPRYVTSYARRKLPGWQKTSQKLILINHVQINPGDKDLLGFAHERAGLPEEDSDDARRVWTIRTNGTDMQWCGFEDYRHETYTHETFGQSGKTHYWVSWRAKKNAIIKWDLKKRKQTVIFESPDRPNHISVSPDERWIAGDNWAAPGEAKDGNPVGQIMLANAKTGEYKTVAEFYRSERHPMHPHPNFSPDGKKIAFVLMEGKGIGQVAYIDVSDLIKNYKPGDWKR